MAGRLEVSSVEENHTRFFFFLFFSRRGDSEEVFLIGALGRTSGRERPRERLDDGFLGVLRQGDSEADCRTFRRASSSKEEDLGKPVVFFFFFRDFFLVVVVVEVVVVIIVVVVKIVSCDVILSYFVECGMCTM
eukprot:CAMPEP_0201143892 /NCGR_PEP_ID=MMETSP0851-20130426/5648_1 /ASSEMBLY_ACC=CAM_ASM_000631 /TAXON_ID=183588 /ORGANISM="Pseudo-nitzschia fraudulenta, Strain WWA7" /LENGTH=133 /DNA_ID=CAMNT_0047418377 /DNA_START=743 /DNA_END=1144 /DNA_ORIENTATION=+